MLTPGNLSSTTPTGLPHEGHTRPVRGGVAGIQLDYRSAKPLRQLHFGWVGNTNC